MMLVLIITYIPMQKDATQRPGKLAAATRHCLNNALKHSLLTTLLHNLVLATPRSIPIQPTLQQRGRTVAAIHAESSPEQLDSGILMSVS